MNDIEKIKTEHVENYKKALIETINNNTNALFDEDIASLLKTPPLDSMDVIKSKFLDLAKKNKIVLDASKLTNMINSYHDECLKICEPLKKIRIDFLSDKVNCSSFDSEKDTIKFIKKDFYLINKEIKVKMKKSIKEITSSKILSNVDQLFMDDVDSIIKKKIINDLEKYINGNYQKQLFENIDFKILVKDTILINSFKEQSERYLFTLENSRLFDID